MHGGYFCPRTPLFPLLQYARKSWKGDQCMHDQCKGDQCMFAFSYKTTKIQHFPPPLVVSTLQHFVSSLPTTQGSRSLAHKPPQIPGSGFWVLSRWRAWFTSITCQLKVIYAAYIAWKSEVQTFPINDINAQITKYLLGSVLFDFMNQQS